MNLLIGAITIGLILSLLAVGVFITYRVFDRIDLTAEGSYGVGAAMAGVLLVRGVDPLLATACGAAAGALAGGLTGVLRIWLSVPLLLSGIVTSTALYTIILYLMHGGDLSLASQRTLVSLADDIGSQLAGGSGDLVLFGTSVSARNWMGLLLTFTVVAGVAVLLNVFFRTNLGLSLRATGNNRMMARAQGIDVGWSLVLAFALSNGLIGLSGAIFAQFIGFVNVTLGAGILATGLASLMIGEVLFGRRGVGRSISAAIAGSVVFRLLVSGALRMGLDPNGLKLLTALFVLAAMVIPRATRGWFHSRPSLEGRSV
jgi:putative ABC transport system permease protein